MYAHLRVSKHSPYVLKFPIQSATSSLHFKNHYALGDDQTVAGWKYAIQNHYAVVIIGNCHVVISCSVNFELDIATRNLPVPTPSIVILNFIFLIYNVPVTTLGAVA